MALEKLMHAVALEKLMHAARIKWRSTRLYTVQAHRQGGFRDAWKPHLTLCSQWNFSIIIPVIYCPLLSIRKGPVVKVETENVLALSLSLLNCGSMDKHP